MEKKLCHCHPMYIWYVCFACVESCVVMSAEGCCLVMSSCLLLCACEIVTVVIASLAVFFSYTTLNAVVYVYSEGDMLIYYNLASIV